MNSENTVRVILDVLVDSLLRPERVDVQLVRMTSSDITQGHGRRIVAHLCQSLPTIIAADIMRRHELR